MVLYGVGAKWLRYCVQTFGGGTEYSGVKFHLGETRYDGRWYCLSVMSDFSNLDEWQINANGPHESVVITNLTQWLEYNVLFCYVARKNGCVYG